MTAVDAVEESFAKLLADGGVDLVVEAFDSGNGPYVVAAVAIDTKRILSEAARLTNSDGQSVWTDERDTATIYRFSDASDSSSPFGPDARAFFIAAGRQTWVLLGDPKHIDEVVARSSRAARPLRESGGHLAEFSVDLAGVFRMQKSSGEPIDDGIEAIASRLPADAPPIRFTIDPAKDGFDAKLSIPASLTQAVVNAFVEEAR